ncbi:aquaporin-8 isoform X1 [Monodon monoceros]|uniref:aquaporin-8 isoform X1 n=1 Tax=Monodon monoceros TaxID=40151 RepID=UPI0010F8454D|nr:aquaporin-8 isoform X1 [Monodon monoceros]
MQLLGALERAEGQFPTVFLSGPPWGLGVGQEWCCPPLPGSPPPLGTSGKVGLIWCLFSTWAALDRLRPLKATWGGGGAAGTQCLGLGLTTPSAFVGDSGGHFNPAVSLAAMLVGGLHLMMLLPYWISQLCGGLIGAALAKAVSSEERFWNASGAAFVTVQEPRQVTGAVVAEIILTTLLALAVCMGTINEKTQGPLAPFSIGFSVTVDILAGGAVSGACMNPARAFGPAVVANHWDFHWIYWLGPLLASLLVGVLIRFFIGDGKTRLILKGR